MVIGGMYRLHERSWVVEGHTDGARALCCAAVAGGMYRRDVYTGGMHRLHESRRDV